MVVIDESSSFKSHQAKRFKSLKNVRRHIRRLVELTGTPSPNGLTDLWAQIYLLDGGQRLGRTLTEYRNNYFIPAARNATTVFSYEPRPGAEEEIQGLIRDICISLSAKDYLELPERVEDVRYIQLDAKARKAYAEMERERVLELPGGLLDAGSAAVLSGKLLQLANGAVYHTANPLPPMRPRKPGRLWRFTATSWKGSWNWWRNWAGSMRLYSTISSMTLGDSAGHWGRQGWR